MTISRLLFLRSMRVTKKKDFDAIYASTQCRRTKNPTIHARQNGEGLTRLGLSVPKKIGNAVIRNSVKRKVREAFRHVYDSMPLGYDIVVTFHNDGDLKREAYEELLVSVLREYDMKCKNE
jgi:ribonuclease P protein component